MNFHEYQAKELLQSFGIPVPPQQVISNEAGLEEALASLGVENVILKVQVHAGGRGKAGGVKCAKDALEAKRELKGLLGMRIKNAQTGKEGLKVEKVLISPLVHYLKEYYLGATIDGRNASPLLIASPCGGMEIEEIAKSQSEALLKTPIQLDGSVRSYHLLEIAKFMGWEDPELKVNGMRLIKQLAKAFVDLDASVLEINPLVALPNQTFLALDAKLSIDDNALFRHKALAEQFDEGQISPLEVLARRYELAYIPLEGNIGCMVNGAGLAMATMDIIEYYGGRPANFLDIGGGASQEKIIEGFKIILSDPHVEVILVNIFGGIMNCETFATGMVAAIREQGIKVPLIVRLEGTHSDEGQAILASSGLNIQVAHSLAEAAELSVRAVNDGHPDRSND